MHFMRLRRTIPKRTGAQWSATLSGGLRFDLKCLKIAAKCRSHMGLGRK
jgi:hypothetical protein